MDAQTPWSSKWNILGPVGEGKQGLVAFCSSKLDEADSRRRVLKRLKEPRDLERRSRMYREVSALRSLRHPGLPTYVDGNTESFADIDVPLYFVMDYIPGPTLSATIQGAPLTFGSAIQLTLFLIETVEYCHQRGVVHRDIKPDNIVIRDGDPSKPVLIDFGLTFNRDEPAGLETEADRHIGNRFLFMVEQRGSAQERRDPRSDLTSCCGILYYVLTAAAPIVMEDTQGAKPHQRPEAKRAMQKLLPHQRVALNGIFDRAFQTLPGWRWQSASALRDSLMRASLTSAPPPAQDPKDRLARIRTLVESRPERAYELKVREALETSNGALVRAQEAVLASLGTDFIDSRGGYVLDVAHSFLRNTLGILRASNPSDGVQATFETRVTGTELVVVGNSAGAEVAILRTPVEEPIPLEQLEEAAFAYFTSELEKALST